MPTWLTFVVASIVGIAVAIGIAIALVNRMPRDPQEVGEPDLERADREEKR